MSHTIPDTYPGLHLDRFSAGLDELKRREQRDPAAVLRVLERSGRFSAFEASATAAIASTLDLLIKRDLIRTTPLGYPWTTVEITEAGRAFLIDPDTTNQL